MSLTAKFQHGPLDGQLRAVPEDMPFIYAIEPTKPEVAYTTAEALSPVVISHDKIVYGRTVRLEGETAIIMGFDLVYQDVRTLNHFSI